MNPKTATLSFRVISKFDNHIEVEGKYRFLIHIADPDLLDTNLRGEEQLAEKMLAARFDASKYLFKVNAFIKLRDYIKS